MPAVIPWVVKGIAAITWKSVAVFVLKVAASYAIGKLLAPKAPKLGGMGSPIQMTREAAAPRRVIYGQTRVSGPIIFAHVTGAKNSDLHLVIALAGHKLAEIGQILINDEIVDLDVDGNATTSKYVGKLRVRKWLGDQTTADALLVTESDGLWTSAHVCQGVACIYAKLVFDQEVFPQGIPNISAIVKGREVYDPRVDATAWTDNPALCALDYMRDTDVGFAAEDGEIDYASHAAAANVCDEAVALAAGGTEKRYRCAGVFATDGEPASIIEQLVGTMSGTMVYSGGKFALKAGAYEIPTIEFDESHLRGPIQFQTDSSRREVCNIVKGTYTSAPDLYQPRDFPQWVDAVAVTADAEEITRDLALDWVHSASQAQRLAAIEERASRLGGTIILQCNLSGLRVQVGDTITVKNTRFGWTAGEVFKVVQFKFSAGDGAVGVDLTCRRTAASVYAWVSTSESAVTPGAVPNGGDDIYTIPGADGRLPGTIDELNNEGTAPTPSGSITLQTLGGTWTKAGLAQFVPDTGSRDLTKRYRTATGTGTITFVGRDAYCTQVWETRGATRYSATTGAVVETSALWIGGSFHSYISIPSYQSHALNTCCESDTSYSTSSTTTVWSEWHTAPGYTCASATGTHVTTLSDEDTESDAVARVTDATSWTAATTTAIRTVPTSVITGIHRRLRYGTYTYNSTTLEWDLVPLAGLVPLERYALRATLSRRPVDQYGASTGAWVDLGYAYSPPFISNADGEGSVAWQEIDPIPGYETSLSGLAAVQF